MELCMCIISLFILTLNMLKTLFQCCIYMFVKHSKIKNKNRMVALLKTDNLPNFHFCHNHISDTSHLQSL